MNGPWGFSGRQTSLIYITITKCNKDTITQKKDLSIAVCQITLKTQRTNQLNGYYVNAVLTVFNIMDANFCMIRKCFQSVNQMFTYTQI